MKRFALITLALMAILTLAVPSANAQKIYVAGYATNAVYYHNALFGNSLKIPVGEGPFDVQITSDGWVYVSQQVDGSVAVINAATNQVTSTIGTSAMPGRMAIGNNETRLYVACLENIIVIDISKLAGGTRKNTVIGSIDLGSYGPPMSIATYHDTTTNRDLLVTGTSFGFLVAYDAANSSAPLGVVDCGSLIHSLAFSDNGGKIYAGLDRSVEFIDRYGNSIYANLFIIITSEIGLMPFPAMGLAVGEGDIPSMTVSGTNLTAVSLDTANVFSVDTRTDRIVRSISMPEGSVPFASTTLALRTYVTDLQLNQVEELLIGSRRILRSFPLESGSSPFGIAATLWRFWTR